MRRQLAVTYQDNTTRYYPVTFEGGGWKINPTDRLLVIGKGVPRTMVPLDGVLCFVIEDLPE